MVNTIRKAWTEMVWPMFRRPKRFQVGALCFREDGDDRKVLLVTSRDTGRWIIPKGWPINGKNAAEAALQEAWEEAGVKKGDVSEQAIGVYNYDKELKGGLPVPVETHVFPVEVRKLSDAYPEADERKRKWVSPEKAANMVLEPQLQEILRNL